MTITKFILAAVLLVSLFCNVGVTAPVRYDDHAMVRVWIDSRADLTLLGEISPDIWSETVVSGMPVLARIPPDRMDRLISSGLVFDVIAADIGPESARYYPSAREQRPRGDATIYEEYKTYSEMVTVLNDLQSACPQGLTCNVFSIGESVEGTDIWAMEISGNETDQETKRPAILLQGLQHAREWITGSTILCTADYIVNNYGSDAELTELLNNLTFYLIPCVNPDGYQYTWDEDRYWRKNLRDNLDGTFGVDLNRNWGFMWGWNDVGSSSITEDSTYRGTGPFSEPETEAVANLVNENPELVAYLDIHSYGQMIIMPWGFTTWSMHEGDSNLHHLLGYQMALTIAGFDDTVYSVITGTDLYETNGTALDWFYGDRLGLSLTFELPPSSWDWKTGFELGPDQIAPTCEETIPGFMQAASWAVENAGYEATVPDEGYFEDPDYDTDEDDTGQDDTGQDDDTEDTDTSSDDDENGDECEDVEEDDSSCGCVTLGYRSSRGLFETLVSIIK